MASRTSVRHLAAGLTRLRAFVLDDLDHIRSRSSSQGGLRRWLERKREGHLFWYKFLWRHDRRIREDAQLNAMLEGIEACVAGVSSDVAACAAACASGAARGREGVSGDLARTPTKRQRLGSETSPLAAAVTPIGTPAGCNSVAELGASGSPNARQGALALAQSVRKSPLTPGPGESPAWSPYLSPRSASSPVGTLAPEISVFGDRDIESEAQLLAHPSCARIREVYEHVRDTRRRTGDQ